MNVLLSAILKHAETFHNKAEEFMKIYCNIVKLQCYEWFSILSFSFHIPFIKESIKNLRKKHGFLKIYVNPEINRLLCSPCYGKFKATLLVNFCNSFFTTWICCTVECEKKIAETFLEKAEYFRNILCNLVKFCLQWFIILYFWFHILLVKEPIKILETKSF